MVTWKRGSVRGEGGDDLAKVLQIGGVCVCFAVQNEAFDEVFEVLRVSASIEFY